jgi:hypothetical protein
MGNASEQLIIKEASVTVLAERRKTMVHVRLEPELVKLIDYLGAEWDMYRNEVVAKLITEALAKYDPARLRQVVLQGR